jgi:hypothetical protein
MTAQDNRKPTTTGWDPAHIARAWTVLMKRLGYTKFVAQGGDWGDAVTEQIRASFAPLSPRKTQATELSTL